MKRHKPYQLQSFGFHALEQELQAKKAQQKLIRYSVAATAWLIRWSRWPHFHRRAAAVLNSLILNTNALGDLGSRFDDFDHLSDIITGLGYNFNFWGKCTAIARVSCDLLKLSHISSARMFYRPILAA